MKTDKSDGFSLVEMLAAMTIAAVTIALFAGNPFAKKQRHVSVAQIARELGVAIVALEAKAVSKATAFPIWVDVKSREITIDEKKIKLPEQFKLSLQTGAELILHDARGAIWLLPDGTSSGGEITLQGPSGQVRTVRINWVTGAVKISGAES